MNLFTLLKTEEAIKFLQEKGILPITKKCQNGHEMTLSIGDKARWRCGKSTCRYDVKLRVGNWLEGSRIPIVTVIRFIYCWCHELTSVEFCEHELQMNKNTTTDWNNYMRCICIDYLTRKPQRAIGIYYLT